MLTYNCLMPRQPYASSVLGNPFGNCFRLVADEKLHENPVLKLVNERVADTHSVGGFFVEQALRKILHEFVFTRGQIPVGSQ